METLNFNLNLSDGWIFHQGELDRIEDIPVAMSHMTSKAGGALKAIDFFKEGTEWKKVSIPHDWITELDFDKNEIPAAGFKKRGTGWYYISFELSDKKIESATLVFDGVLGKCEVFVNGVLAVRNFSGYNRFSAEIGDYLLSGQENIIAVYVDATRWEGWWYEGAGIYRNVYIEFRKNTHLDKEKIFVRSKKTDIGWKIICDASVINETQNTYIKATLKDEDKNIISEKFLKDNKTDFSVENPELWSPENPYLYEVCFELLDSDKIIDILVVNTAFRCIEWKADSGMYLNGQHYPVKGICCHQDHAGVGAAITKEIMEYRISVLKNLGVNAYRVAHHAPDEELLDICDRLGMLVMAENRHFSVSDDVLKQLDSLVTISRNHPSVFLYSLFNEEPWQAEERGRRIAEKMRLRVLELDDTRPVIGAQNGGLLEKSNTSDVLDVIGINYALKDYDEAHKRLSDKVLIGTENCPTYATRGVCKTDKEKQIFSCYGDEYPDYFSENITETMSTVYSKPFVAGCFTWSGFDYRGEPTPYEWPSVLSHWGFTDYCGFKKDTAYLLEAWYKNELCVHLLPHWNHNVGEEVRVMAFTNGDTAELFVNGKSFGEKEVMNKITEWKVPFEKGEIEICAKKGEQILYDVVKTAEEPFEIKLLDAVSGNSEIHIVNLSVTDENGTVIPNYCEKIKFTLDNELALLAYGDSVRNSDNFRVVTEKGLFDMFESNQNIKQSLHK